MSDLHLVTGGAGFIGSHLVDKLLSQGKRVRVLDSLATGKEKNIISHGKLLDFRLGDIRDAKTVLSAMNDATYVYHLAALGSVPFSIQNPQMVHDVNVVGTLTLLEAARLTKPKCFVFASSSSVYGKNYHHEVYEDLPTKAASPYGLTKLAAERYCTLYEELYGVPAIALRFFNVFGPRQPNTGAVIPSFINSILDDVPVRVHGSTQISRDFTYVDRVVEACVRASEGFGVGEVFNVAEGIERSLDDVLFFLLRILKREISSIRIDALPWRKGDILRSKANVSKLKHLFGEIPETDFEAALTHTVEYYRRQK